MLSEKIEEIKNSNKIGHAYLFYNVETENIEEELIDTISSFFYNGNKNDLYIIKPENDKINKDQIKELEHTFSQYSLAGKERIYIIFDADKMNAYAANSLLKFLEEPENDIYAFLTTSNINNVLPTISSRCIKVTINVKKDRLLEEEKELCQNLYELLNSKQKNVNEIYEIFADKSRLEIKKILSNFITILDFKLQEEKNDNKELIKKILFLNDIIKRLDYNVNVQSFIDKLIVNW